MVESVRLHLRTCEKMDRNEGTDVDYAERETWRWGHYEPTREVSGSRRTVSRDLIKRSVWVKEKVVGIFKGFQA